MTSVPGVDPTRIGRYSPHPGALEAESSSAAGEGVAHPPLPQLDVLLAAAAADVCASWEREGRDGHTSDEIAGPIAIVTAALRRAIGGEVIEVTGLPPTLASRRMVDLFRRAVVARLGREGEVPEGAALVRLFAAFERVQEALDRDAAQRFTNRLSGTDGTQLVIEVAHDMRSPLGSILFLAERLRTGQSGVVSPIQERQLGLIYSAAFGLSSLASDVIELARGGDRLVDHDPIPFSVSELLQAVRDILQPVAEEKGLALRLTPPETDSRIGYPAALNRVLLNLTTNALKFTAAGSVDVVCRQVSRASVEFSVRDTGRGIPGPVLDTLFDAFRRRQRPGDYTFSSAGLGLSICQKLVRAMGGEMKVETEVEKGTRFFFQLELPASQTL
jgi:signal transduction histidine kinase